MRNCIVLIEVCVTELLVSWLVGLGIEMETNRELGIAVNKLVQTEISTMSFTASLQLLNTLLGNTAHLLIITLIPFAFLLNPSHVMSTLHRTSLVLIHLHILLTICETIPTSS